jgi:hypothetical protein
MLRALLIYIYAEELPRGWNYRATASHFSPVHSALGRQAPARHWHQASHIFPFTALENATNNLHFVRPSPKIHPTRCTSEKLLNACERMRISNVIHRNLGGAEREVHRLVIALVCRLPNAHTGWISDKFPQRPSAGGKWLEWAGFRSGTGSSRVIRTPAMLSAWCFSLIVG